jgi:sugar lactone lactonase YvrE
LDVIASQVTDPVAFHGEGPFWDVSRERLLFVDMLAGAVVSLEHGEVARYPVASVAAVIRARAGGGYLFAVERGFVLADADLRPIDVLPEVFSSPQLRMNEGGCDPQGRFYCGSMAYAETPGAGTLYRLDADLSVHTVLPSVSISNGLQWSADGSRVFYNDSPSGRIDVFDFDGSTAEFSNRRVFAAIPDSGIPDGMAIDSEDGVWVALWGGSKVQHYDAGGHLVEIIELPVTNVTACTFGGKDLTTLYITTSRLGIAEGTQPLAGSVFSVEAGVRGAVPFAFTG